MAVEIVATGDALVPWALVVDGKTIDYESMVFDHDTRLGTCSAAVDFGGGRIVRYEDVAVRPEVER